mmetsp:Transcript_10281/g.31431  ORF Transcript_10281/g.31431 Transcript_10281/m.31431 type:complete len:289 (-) Transcript_10281:1009-1875(-)
MLGSRARRSDLDLTLGGGLVSRFHSQVQSVLCVDCCTSYKISLYFLWRVEQLHVEVANGDRKSHNGLEHGKLVSYTLTGTAAKRQKRKVTDDLIGKQRFVSDCTAALPADHLWVLERARPSVRIKLVRVLPKVRRPMHIPHADENICPSRHLDRSLSSSLRPNVISEGSANEERRLGVQAQGLGKHSAQVSKLLEVVPARVVGVAHDLVNLRAETCNYVGSLEHEEGCPRQQRCSSLVPRDKHRHQVVAQLCAGGLLAPQVDEVPQKGGILHIVVVTLLELLEVGLTL